MDDKNWIFNTLTNDRLAAFRPCDSKNAFMGFSYSQNSFAYLHILVGIFLNSKVPRFYSIFACVYYIQCGPTSIYGTFFSVPHSPFLLKLTLELLQVVN